MASIAQTSTADTILNALATYGLKKEHSGEYRCNSPLRPDSDSMGFTLKISDPEHGTFYDHVSGDAGSLYELAERLNIPIRRNGNGKSPTESKRAYTGLDDYAHAHGVKGEVYAQAGWQECRYQNRTALRFTTETGNRWRFLDGSKPTFKSQEGYTACWYGLDRAFEIAVGTGQPLVLCNGEPSVIAAQHWGVAACAQTGGEKAELRPEVLKKLRDMWNGDILLAGDCDDTGDKWGRGLADQLRAAGYTVRVVDLNGGKGFDLADFCNLHQEQAADQLAQAKERIFEPTPEPPVEHQPEQADIMAAFSRGQLGDAELLRMLKGGKILFDHSEGLWHIWNGHYWVKDRVRDVDTIIGTELASLYLLAASELRKVATEAAQKLSQGLTARAGELFSKHRRDSVLDQAKTLPGLKITGDEWDQNPWLLGVENGVIDLRTGELHPGDSGDYIRSIAPVEWKGLDEPCPRWEQFISEILTNDPESDAEVVAFMQRLLGYGITGLRDLHQFPILWGEDGRNGKGTLKEVLSKILGPDLTFNIPATVLAESRDRDPHGPKPFLYALQGKRLVFASETNKNVKIDEALVKLLAGGDTITARTLHTREKSFVPSHLLFLITNPKPEIDASDKAIWERVALIQFSQRYLPDPDPNDPNQHKQDEQLITKLMEERSGILAWLVRGCLEWQAEGINVPDVVRANTRQYQKESDFYAQFAAECLNEHPNLSAKTSAVQLACKNWCTLGGERFNRSDFSKWMKAHYKFDHTKAGDFYYGVGLIREENTTQE